jgi:GT2 family glycosyltransferase
MDLSIIIVNYNSKSKLLNCLQSIYDSNFNNLNWEIIVVENNSLDDLSDIVKKYKNLKLIASEKNLGMGGGNNLGIKHSSGDYILISNPDIIFKKNCIVNLYSYIKKNNECALVGPKLVYPNGQLQYSSARFPKIYLPILRRTLLGRFFPNYLNNYFLKSDSYDKIREVNWLLGACFIVKRNEFFITKDKLFDERFFMYFEDVDLGKRINKKNKKVVYLPSAIAIHDHIRASARYKWYLAVFKDKLAKEHIKSWLRYFLKWGFK